LTTSKTAQGAQQDRQARRRTARGAEMGALLRFELRLKALVTAARMLPALTADNGAQERARLIAELERGDQPVPRFQLPRRPVPGGALRMVDALRREAEELPGAGLYTARLDELELELLLLDALGRPRVVRPLSARRYGTGATLVPTRSGPMTLRACARRILDAIAPTCELRELPADGGEESLGAMVRALAHDAGLDVRVQLEPRLAAGAATGERTVFISTRCFGRIEARRLAVHEVLGHLVAAANGRCQPLRLLEWGTANSYMDQEGLALYLEEAHGLMNGERLRTLAGRVLAADLMHAGASFAEAARRLHRDEHFGVAETITLCERAYRGGGVARDVGYLRGWLRVHDAISRGEASIDALRAGRIGLCALPAVRQLCREGYARDAAYRPNLARSLSATSDGTMPSREPPSDAASLIRVELTKK